MTTATAEDGRGHGQSDPICVVAVAGVSGWERNECERYLSWSLIQLQRTGVYSSRTGIESNLQAKVTPVPRS